MVALGALSVLIALLSAVAGALGVLPDAGAVVTVLAMSAVALRLLTALHMRRIGPSASARTARIVPLALLGVSLISVVVTYVVAGSQGGTPATAVDDLIRNGAVIGVLIVISLPSRTLGWQTAVGAAMVGFLGAPALSRLVGLPVVDALGADSVWASSVWVPLTEEAIKALPAAMLVLLASRNRDAGPAVVDIVTVGGAAGAGFALFEDLQYQRAPGDMWSFPPFSLLFPTIEQAQHDGTVFIVAGHAIWTALIALGLAIGVLWRRRYRFAWVALPAAFLIATLEHGILNVGDAGGVLGVVVAWGALSTILVTAGTIAATIVERRPVHGPDNLVGGLLLRPPGVTAHRRRLARLRSVAGAR